MNCRRNRDSAEAQLPHGRWPMFPIEGEPTLGDVERLRWSRLPSLCGREGGTRARRPGARSGTTDWHRQRYGPNRRRFDAGRGLVSHERGWAARLRRSGSARRRASTNLPSRSAIAQRNRTSQGGSDRKSIDQPSDRFDRYRGWSGRFFGAASFCAFGRTAALCGVGETVGPEVSGADGPAIEFGFDWAPSAAPPWLLACAASPAGLPGTRSAAGWDVLAAADSAA